MASYRVGSMGNEVRRIQTRLRELGFYRGPVDGTFGGGTLAAARLFQRAEGLEADGVVGPATWAKLFPARDDSDTITGPAILRKPLAFRCLALTGAFETGMPIPDCFAGLSGDFDRMGISFGVLQWCLGQGSLQPLLRKMSDQHGDELEAIFGDHVGELRAMLAEDLDDQLEWARRIQDPVRFRIHEPWRGLFKTLGRHEAFQNIEVAAADHLFREAKKLCADYGVRSERAVALLFDIKTQNGSIRAVVKAQIERDFARLGAGAGEVERLRIIANRRAEAANPRWVEDVRKRKLTIANGAGIVHGSHFDLEEQYGIRLTENF